MLFIYLILFFEIIYVKRCNTLQAKLVVIRAGQCAGNKYNESIVKFSEMSIKTKGETYLLSGFVYVKEDMPNGWSIRATKHKCADIRSIETCDYLRSFIVLIFACEVEESGDSAALRAAFNRTTPRMSCPVKAGLYQFQDYNIVMKSSYFVLAEAKISTSLFGYSLNIEGFNMDEQMIFCMEVRLQLSRRREQFPDLVDELLDSAETTETTTDHFD